MHFSITAEIFNEKAEEARHPRLTRLGSARLGSARLARADSVRLEVIGDTAPTLVTIVFQPSCIKGDDTKEFKSPSAEITTDGYPGSRTQSQDRPRGDA